MIDYEELKRNFERTFGRKAQHVFSAPGRTELSGNHTDHQHGKVLAAAIDRETAAAVAENDREEISMFSEGYGGFAVSLDELSPKETEFGTPMSLVRGVAAKFRELGKKTGGFDAYISSEVLPGSGLSSSAAFEVLTGTVLNDLSGAGFTPVEIARIGQYAENVFFGKPCGLMDQMASAVGNAITIDFQDPAQPVIRNLLFDFSSCGHKICIVNSGAHHEDLTEEYAAITSELSKVSCVFGKRYLREVPEEEFYTGIAKAREICGDRAVLRAMHVYEENRRVEAQVKALEEGDFESFLSGVRMSGISSWRFLQNVAPTGSTVRQELAFSIALAEKLLGGRGAARVHGGGFAGTLQAFVPDDMAESFRAGMDAVLGEGSCRIMEIRKEGGIRRE